MKLKQMKMAQEGEAEWARQCSVCYRNTSEVETDFITCEGCGAMIYCGKECQLRDWGPEATGTSATSSENAATSSMFKHQDWCHRMKGYTAGESELSDLPFTFIKETTDRLFHEQRLAEFLKRHGVYGQGLWRRESPLLHQTQPVHRCGHFTRIDEDKWVLPGESSVLESPPTTPAPPPSHPFENWRQYYTFRELPLHSPVAAILTYPMTLYYIVTTLLRKDDAELFKRVEVGEELEVHMLGVEKEVEMKEAFLECARLLPSCKLHITMCGRQISKSVDQYHWEKENLRISVCRALYHEADLPSPHIAVGFNAGLPAYRTWTPTLSKLMKQGTWAYFTDQSECSCDGVSAAIGSLGLWGISPVVVNPFRSPLRIAAREHNMPLFPNAFLFTLVYSGDG